MPIIVASSIGVATTSAQDIVNEVSQDIRKVLDSSGADAVILLDYLNRVHLDILSRSEWTWMKSGLQTFVTRPYVPTYYFGTGITTSAHNTGLNLSDVRYIDPHSLRDRSNNLPLPLLKTAPPGAFFFNAALTRGVGRPLVAEYNPDYDDYTVTLHPTPDNQNTVQVVPDAPVCTTTAGGALAARYYSVKATYIDSAGGESTPSRPARIFIPAGQLLVASAPSSPTAGASLAASSSGVTITQVHIYANQIEGNETRQGTVSFANTFIEPGSGLVAGAALPTVNTLEPVRGYLIEFSYYLNHEHITNLADILQIPDDYKHVVKAGVNALAFEYLKKPEDVVFWSNLYERGIRQMISDKNTFGPSFIRPSN